MQDSESKSTQNAQLTGYSSAGCITYVELDSGIKNNLDALETLVNYAMDRTFLISQLTFLMILV